MINLNANRSFKALGARWNGVRWEAPALAKKEFEEINSKFYKDMIVVEINHDSNSNADLDWDYFGYKHAKTVAGYIIATACGRDSGAVIADGVAVIKGRFTSEVAENRYSYTIINDSNKDQLTQQRDALLKKLEEIEQELKNFN